MNDSHALSVIYGFLFYSAFLKKPLGQWLQQGFLHQGPAARAKGNLFNFLKKLHLVPPITLPNIDIRKLTEKPLPHGYEVRLWKSADTLSCLEIYRMNAPRRFPTEVEQEFEEALKREDGSMLVIEDHGRIIACGGVALDGGQGMLFYGLIHPEFQKKGVGRLLLLSRLARLQGPPLVVHIHAVEASIGYYERYGFARFSLWYSHDGGAHPSAGTSLHPEHRQKIIEFLAVEGCALLPALTSKTAAQSQ